MGLEMDKEGKKRFTNEALVKKFDSVFDLVNYSILLAENMIKTGRESRVKSDMQNRAMLILEEIHEGKDHMDEIEVKPAVAAASGPFQANRTQKLVGEDVPLSSSKLRHAERRRHN